MQPFDTIRWGSDALIVAIMSDRVEGIVVALSAIIRRAGEGKVHLVLVADNEILQSVAKRIGHRLASTSGFTLDEANADLQRNGVQPFWMWDQYNSSGDLAAWTNENSIRPAFWDALHTRTCVRACVRASSFLHPFYLFVMSHSFSLLYAPNRPMSLPLKFRKTSTH